MSAEVETKIKELARALARQVAAHRLDTQDLFASWEDMLPGGKSIGSLVAAEFEEVIDEIENKLIASRAVKARLFKK